MSGSYIPDAILYFYFTCFFLAGFTGGGLFIYLSMRSVFNNTPTLYHKEEPIVDQPQEDFYWVYDELSEGE